MSLLNLYSYSIRPPSVDRFPIYCFDRFRYSKHNFIHDQVNFNKLADGTPAQKVYLSSTLNRFIPNVSSPDKRRIAAPSKVSER